MQDAILQNVNALDNCLSNTLMYDGSILSQNLRPLTLNIKSNDACPICSYGIDLMRNAWHNFHDITSVSMIEFNVFAVHICPHCHNGFVVKHHMRLPKPFDTSIVSPIGFTEYVNHFAFEESQSVYPYAAQDIVIDNDIKRISPKFYDIYKQCLMAKQYELFEIYGAGLRKALEYFVRDFAIYWHPTDKDKILEDSLHGCIVKYFNNLSISDDLLASKWLGNNEVHYDSGTSIKDLPLFENLIEDIIDYVRKKLRDERVQQINNSKGKK